MRNVLTAARKMAEEYGLSKEDGDADHLFCLLDYLSAYPDKVHHPTEDEMFKKLLKMDLNREEREALRRNQAQHQELETDTENLNTLFNELRDDLDTDQLLFALDSYSKKQLEHMAFEEQVTFPLALEKLPQSSWRKLAEQFDKNQDPLFDTAQTTYAALYQHLVSDPDVPDDTPMSDALLRFLDASVIGQR